MSAITKERIKLFIKNPLDNGLTRGEQMELARIALASLEAKPIGAFHIAEQQVDGTSDYIKDGEWPIDNGIIEVYAAPPVPVVPEEKPMPNALSMLEREITQLISDAQNDLSPEHLPCDVVLVPGMRIHEGVRTKTLLTALQRRAKLSSRIKLMPSKIFDVVKFTPSQHTERDK